MSKDHDLYAWKVSFERVGEALNDATTDLTRVADAIKRSGGVGIRTIRMEDWDREVALVRRLFNETLNHLPDAVPIGEDEFRHLAEQMRPFLDRDLVLFAMVDGVEVGFCVVIPDTNRLLMRLNGRLFPFNWLRVGRLIRRIDVVSFKLMGVRERYRNRGIDAVLYLEALKAASRRGYRWLDGSLTSELNPPINLIAERRGAEKYKHYRLYRMEL
jgi:GNAT superfamily N-acetyltransferase